MATETDTLGDQRFVVPTVNDPAAMALDLEKLAVPIDDRFSDVTHWSDYTAAPPVWSEHRPWWTPYGGATDEIGTPAVMRSLTAPQGPWVQNVERSVAWDSTTFTNVGSAFLTGVTDMAVPDQEQPYWWWIGCNIVFAQTVANTRLRSVVYVQDRDPATGYLLTSVLRNNAYAAGNGNECILFDGFVRSGGGRMRLGFTHGSPASLNMQVGTYMWAVRVVPDRW